MYDKNFHTKFALFFVGPGQRDHLWPAIATAVNTFDGEHLTYLSLPLLQPFAAEVIDGGHGLAPR
jgi:hypothetical protein